MEIKKNASFKLEMGKHSGKKAGVRFWKAEFKLKHGFLLFRKNEANDDEYLMMK